MKSAAERRKKEAESIPNTSGRVEETRINAESSIAEIFENTKFERSELVEESKNPL